MLVILFWNSTAWQLDIENKIKKYIISFKVHLKQNFISWQCENEKGEAYREYWLIILLCSKYGFFTLYEI